MVKAAPCFAPCIKARGGLTERQKTDSKLGLHIALPTSCSFISPFPSWMMSRYATGTRYFMSQQTVIIMIGWLVVCLIGLIPGVANTEHVAGLVVGVVWGFLRSGHLGTLTRRRRFRG